MSHDRYTSLEGDDVGLLVRGTPENVAALIENARELGRDYVAVLTDAGLFYVLATERWVLRAVYEEEDE